MNLAKRSGSRQAPVRWHHMMLPLVMVLLFSATLRPDERPEFVSMVRLIANPERYNGKLITFVGYFVVETDGTAVFMSSEDYEHQITANALWIETTDQIRHKEETLNMNYVLFVGVYHASNLKSIPFPSGEITQIARSDLWSKLGDPRAEKWNGHKPSN